MSWERTQPAKSGILCLYHVYRIMHSISGGNVPCLSNLMSSYSKWNVSKVHWDEKLLPVNSWIRLNSSKIHFSFFFCVAILKGKQRSCKLGGPVNPVLPASDLLAVMDQVLRGEQDGQSLRSHFSKGWKKKEKKRYKRLLGSWYWLNPFAIYIFTSTSLLATQ